MLGVFPVAAGLERRPGVNACADGTARALEIEVAEVWPPGIMPSG
jgi:hypothetical protein